MGRRFATAVGWHRVTMANHSKKLRGGRLEEVENLLPIRYVAVGASTPLGGAAIIICEFGDFCLNLHFWKYKVPKGLLYI